MPVPYWEATETALDHWITHQSREKNRLPSGEGGEEAQLEAWAEHLQRWKHLSLDRIILSHNHRDVYLISSTG